jgi:hypothetical protein
LVRGWWDNGFRKVANSAKLNFVPKELTIKFPPRASLGSLYTSDALFPHTRLWVGEAQGDRELSVPEGRMLGLALRNLDAATIGDAIKEAFKHLQSVDLSTSYFSDSTLRWLSYVDELKELRLDFLKLRASELVGLIPMSSLSTLWLTGAEMGDAELASFAPSPSIEHLILKSTRISDAGLTHLSAMKKLSRLHLPTQITDAGIAHLASCKSLRKLDLSLCAITDKAIPMLENIVGLEELYLNDTKLGDEALSAIGKLKSLKVLFLCGTKISDSGLTYLEQLENLEHLELRDTKVSEVGTQRVRSRLANCAIFGP